MKAKPLISRLQRVREDVASLSAQAQFHDGGGVLACMSALATSLSRLGQALLKGRAVDSDTALDEVLNSLSTIAYLKDLASDAAETAWNLQEVVVLNSHGEMDDDAALEVENHAADLEHYLDRITSLIEEKANAGS